MWFISTYSGAWLQKLTETESVTVSTSCHQNGGKYNTSPACTSTTIYVQTYRSRYIHSGRRTALGSSHHHYTLSTITIEKKEEIIRSCVCTYMGCGSMLVFSGPIRVGQIESMTWGSRQHNKQPTMLEHCLKATYISTTRGRRRDRETDRHRQRS